MDFIEELTNKEAELRSRRDALAAEPDRTRKEWVAVYNCLAALAGKRKRGANFWTKEKLDTVRAMISMGKTHAEIADAVGSTESAVHNVTSKHKIRSSINEPAGTP